MIDFSILHYCLFVCLFVLELIVPLENFSLIWRRHHYQWRAANFDLCSALVAMEQWGFFSMPHLLWHGALVYNCYFRGPATLTSVAEGLAVELLLPMSTPWVCRGWDSSTKSSACEANARTDCSTAAVFTTSLYLNKLNKPEFPTLKNVSCQVWLRW